MDTLLTLKLLNAVMFVENIIDFSIDRNEVSYTETVCLSDDQHIFTNKINIFELANYCREWAIKQGYFIFSGSDPFFTTGKCTFHYLDNYGNNAVTQTFTSDCELNAIFKACDWLLEKKD